MKTLTELLLTPDKRPHVVKDSEQVVNEEVSSKSGLSGAAIKATFAVVKALKPTMIRDSVDALLDDFVARLEPLYADYQNQSGNNGIESYVVGRSGDVAEALLGITDARAARSTNSTLKKAYEKLRPKGKEQVVAAMPRVGRMLARHGA